MVLAGKSNFNLFCGNYESVASNMCQPHDGAGGKVRGSASVWFVLWGSRTSAQKLRYFSMQWIKVIVLTVEPGYGHCEKNIKINAADSEISFLALFHTKTFCITHNATQILVEIWRYKTWISYPCPHQVLYFLCQACPKYGLGANYGPWSDFIWPKASFLLYIIYGLLGLSGWHHEAFECVEH